MTPLEAARTMLYISTEGLYDSSRLPRECAPRDLPPAGQEPMLPMEVGGRWRYWFCDGADGIHKPECPWLLFPQIVAAVARDAELHATCPACGSTSLKAERDYRGQREILCTVCRQCWPSTVSPPVDA